MVQSSHGAGAAMKSPGIATPEIVSRIVRNTSEMAVIARSSRWLIVSPSLHFQDHFDLDWDVVRQRRHADRRACVLADGLAEHFHHEIREAVDDLRRIGEVVRA